MKLRKVLSLFVALVMMFEVLPLSSLATEIADATENVEDSAEIVSEETETEEAEETVEEVVEEETVLLGASADEDSSDESGIATVSEDEEITVLASGDCGADGDNVTWVLTSDGTLTISGEGKMKDYTSATSPRTWCSSYGSTIRSVVIEDGVTYIGKYAFCLYNTWKGYQKLKTVSIADSVTSIGYGAFAYCYTLSSVSIPDSVTSIEQFAFGCCYAITSLYIPGSVTSIGRAAFDSCKGLESVTIGEGCISIGQSAFKDCESLTVVYIPNSVTSIGCGAFAPCEKLESVTINDDNTHFTMVDGVLFNKSMTKIIWYPNASTFGQSTYTIPDSVTAIATGAFHSCDNLTGVYMSDNITSIGYEAFWGCSNLADLTLSKSIISIAEYAFSCCDSLIELELPYGLKTISRSAFSYCEGLKSIVIPDSVTSIGTYAFIGCISLENVTLSNSITSISDNMFQKCTSLISITIPDSVTSISKFAFRECYNLESITIPNSVTSIGVNAFLYCNGLTDVYYGGTVSEWNKVSISSSGESYLLSATIHCTDGTINSDGTVDYYVDNTLIAGKDWWSFANYISSNYYITWDEFSDLAEVMSLGTDTYTNRTKLLEKIKNGGANCYGMAVIVCLAKMNGIDVTEIPGYVDSLYNISLTWDLRSYISYWHLQQYSEEYLLSRANYQAEYHQDTHLHDEALTGSKEAFEDIIEMVSEVANGGSPVLFSFGWFTSANLENVDGEIVLKLDSSGSLHLTGHSVVIYDVEYGSWTWNGYEYDICFLTYDSNYPNGHDGKEYIYVNIETGDWTVPTYSDSELYGKPFSSSATYQRGGETYTVALGEIRRATNDISEIDILSQGTSSTNKYAYLTIYKGYDVVVSDSDGASFTIGVCGDLPVYYDENYVSDDDNSSFCGTVILSDLDSAYTMTPGDTVTEVSYTLEYNDSLLIVEGTSVDTIEITQTSVSVSGTDSDVSLGLISNDGYYVTPWYKAELSAEDVDDLSLSMSDTGYVVEGTDLSDITVYGTNDYETVELTFSTDKEKALVTEDSAENMIVLIDEDNNGTYETVIATTDYAGLVEEAKATLSSTDWTLTQSDVESATGSTTADKIATLIDAILAGLGIDSNVTVTFTITDITEAIASDATDVDGTDGSFTINFTISAGNESDTLTETGAITATAYVHTHSLTHVEAVDATCTAVGNTEYWYCSGCDKYYSDENAENEITLADTVTAKIAHNYEAVVTDPTCTEGGYTTYTCSVCKDSYVADEVEATGHNYEAVVTEPTCTESGYTTYTCSVCKDSYVADEVEAIGHSYEAVVTEPTCTEGGYTTYTCSVCKDSYVADETAATGHSYEAVVTEPTCTEGGYTTYTCSVCKDSYVADETAALGHDYTSEVTKEATRTEAGVMTYTCTRGDDSYTVEIPATGHTEAEAVVENEVAATCTTDGSYDSVVYCSDCGEELSRETIVVPAAHTAGTAVRENVVEATRTTEGSYDLVTYCTVCGEEISRETVTVPATGVDMITVWLRTPADYSAVNNAIAKANALNPDDYTNFSDVTDAINAVNWTYNALMQSYVNEMAEKIETAIANLIPVGTTTEEVEIQEPIEDTNTDTEDDEEGSSEISEPETNPTTGIAFSLLPMMIAALAAASTKRR